MVHGRCLHHGRLRCRAALFYGDKIVRFGATHQQTMAYLERLKARPSFARVLKEAEPFFKIFPG
mgnify:CR=1 FL=1